MFALVDLVGRRSSLAFLRFFLLTFADFADAASAAGDTTPATRIEISRARNIAADVTRYAPAMDLEILEALALSDDRANALGQLLPGSEDHDYFRCLHAQHAGALDEADAIIDAWPSRHGQNERYERLRQRQQWYRLGTDPDRVADEIRDRLGVSHWHEAEVAEVDPTRPTKLAPSTFDGARLLGEATDVGSDLSQVTDEGLYELLPRSLDATRRRALLSRIGHTPQPELVATIADDLAAYNAGFGAVRVHHELTLDQLHALAARAPKMRTDRAWIEAVIRRMRPPLTVDLVLDRDARETYVRELWSFVEGLPPASNSLKAHVLWHLLDTIRRRDAAPELSLVLAYLALPRHASFVPYRRIENLPHDQLVQVGTDCRAITALPPAGDDEALVRDLLQRHLAQAEQLAPHLERTWFEAEVAAAQLLAGAGDSARATQILGPARAAELRERVEVAWCVHDPLRFAVDEPIVLDADVKHVPELVVRVFRIDPIAYFQHHKREASTDLDLDGLAASHELTMRFAEPPVRRVRRRIELPMCARAGTYVIDLIGNGIASRAVVHKGRLRFVSRVGAPGHIVTVLDERGTTLPGARAWIGDREYIADAQGTIVVPFSTAPGSTPMLLAHGDVATVASLDLQRESYELGFGLSLDRQTLVAGATARAIARVQLTVAGAPASLALLEKAMWGIRLTDRDGVVTTKDFPLVLSDTDAAVLEWPLGDAVAAVAVSIRGTIKVVSEQREQELARATTIDVADIHRTLATEALYLAHTASGWVVSALGKTGEPRGQRPLTVSLVHRWAHTMLNVELATDVHGRCELGELPGIARISATLGGTTQTWSMPLDAGATAAIQTLEGRDVVVPLAPARDADEVIRRLSLVELRGGVPAHHPRVTIDALAGALVIRGLPPGEYSLRAPGVTRAIRVAAQGAVVAGSIVTGGEIVELSPVAPVIAELAVADALRVRLVGATARTRVHVIATRFLPAPLAGTGLGARPRTFRFDRARGAAYVNGRELGDEYRYVLDRRAANRFPSLQLDKPSLLLNPWARRATSTAVAVPAAGMAFQRAPAPAAPGGFGGGGAMRGGAADEGGYAGYDFLAKPPAVLANLVPDERGEVVVPLAELGRATTVCIVVDDVAGSSRRYVALPEPPLEPKDLRLRLALDPDRHAMQKKAVAPLVPGQALVIPDLATAKLHLVDTVERAHAYLLALRDDATLREFSFVTRWHALADAERRELYSKYACHELHLFLHVKDRAFFDAVVAPYLAHKRTKTFLDHWLLGADLSRYLEPALLATLNAVERALLARRLRAEKALARLLADEVTLLPPDPALDTRIIDALLGAATLDGDKAIAGYAADALAAAETAAAPMASFAAPASRGAPGGPAEKTRSRGKKMAKAEAAEEVLAEIDTLGMDLERRREAAPMFRAADRTQEWAENNWWHRTPSESGAAMIAVSRLWRDLALHEAGAFLSPFLGLAANSFAEAMCALAVVDLPFTVPAHSIVADGPRLTITAAGNTLAGSSQLVDGELVTGGPPLVVGQSYVRTDDRYRYVDGEQVDNYVEGSFVAGVVYTCLVVIANPSSSRQRISALVQIPRGSIALGGAKATHAIDVSLEPYGTHGHEYSFYFPAPGRYSHFPVHVSRGGTIVAAAPGRALDVTAGGDALDPRSWAHVSQRGSVADVVAFLDAENLAAIDLDRVAWRLRDRAAFDAILGALERRRAYHATLWGYALLHRDLPRLRTWARALGPRLASAGPVLDMPIVGLDGEDLGTYEHLEYSPLVNARAHRLGSKVRILNDGFAAQYTRFLELVAHRRAVTPEDRLAAAAYLLAQDRNEAALGNLARVDTGSIADRMQHDYLAAYAACLGGDLPRAHELTARWRDLPVDRWRRRFEALAGMLAEIEGAAPAIVDPRSREQQHADLAAKQPAFEIALDRDGVIVQQQHVQSLELRFFEMDVELLFSRQPFVQSDVSRFSFIEPGHREHLANLAAEQRLPWPAALRGKNVVVEAVGAGQRKAKIHYANDLATNLAHQYGQIRVQRASDRAALPATYVKVYARQRGGSIQFYKDGYTDLRGWFDYATLSTTDLDHVERFAILVCSDRAGSAIVEAGPPAR